MDLDILPVEKYLPNVRLNEETAAPRSSGSLASTNLQEPKVGARKSRTPKKPRATAAKRTMEGFSSSTSPDVNGRRRGRPRLDNKDSTTDEVGFHLNGDITLV